MRIIPLDPPTTGYASNSYLVLGTWNNPQDVTTLVDAGVGAYHIHEIEQLSKGIGKHGIRQIVLTHSHYDHTYGLALLIQRYGPSVCAASKMPGVDVELRDNDSLRMGDEDFQVLLTPGHSEDSLCLFCHRTGDLFIGDTPYNIRTPGGLYPASLLISLRRLAALPVRTIYAGHDAPVRQNAAALLRSTLAVVEKTMHGA
jgi:glyoxylase-like metal-dependent hydrolase (beta-lactamase superfamily II)